MKFRIRFADQIVGVFIIVSILSLIFVIFMLGSRQRWFAKDYQFITHFESAAGLSSNMAVQYKGITIGNVKNFRLTDDDKIEVTFTIQESYTSRVRIGSLVDISVSPIGLGSSFLFYPGLGDVLPDKSTILALNSPEGRLLAQTNLAHVPEQNDSIGLLLARINGVVGNIDGALHGTTDTSIGRTLIGVEQTVTGLTEIPETVNTTVTKLTREVNSVLADINKITAQLSEPGGLVSNVLDGDGAVYANLEASLVSLAGILDNIDRTTNYIPAEMPQISAVLSDVRSAIKNAEDVLISVANNPLLRNGIPQRVQTQTGGTSPRDINF